MKMIFSYLIALIGLVAMTSAQAHGSPGNMPYLSYTSPPASASASTAPTPSDRPAPAPPAAAPAALAPLDPAAPSIAPIAPIAPAPAPSPNPIISLIQSGIQNPAFSPPPTSKYQYENAPTSFALSHISFASHLIPHPRPTTPATDATPGEVRLCTGTTYTSDSGDSAEVQCDAVHAGFDKCLDLSEAFRGRVVSVRPDKGQLCLFFEGSGCLGGGEGIKWPGVRNLRGRIGQGRDWSRRIVSFRCQEEG